MVKKQEKTNRSKPREKKTGRITDEVIKILFIGIWLIIIISLHTRRGGVLGNFVGNLLFGLLGNMSYVYMYAALICTVLMLINKNQQLSLENRSSAGIAFITVIMLLIGLFDNHLVMSIRNDSYWNAIIDAMNHGLNHGGYGLVAAVILYWLVYTIGRIGTGVFLLTIGVVAIWLAFPKLVLAMVFKCKERYQTFQQIRKKQDQLTMIKTKKAAKEELFLEQIQSQLLEYDPVRETKQTVLEMGRAPEKLEEDSVRKMIMETPAIAKIDIKNGFENKEANQSLTYRTPPLSLLKPQITDYQRTDKKKMLKKAKLLEETLASFGVEAKVIKVTQGPTITRYELQPSKGVKVSKVVNLSDDIALNLAASSIRIEAPIPGKAAIGIEIPNEEISMVPLRDLLDTKEYRDFTNPLPFVLGKNVAGEPIISDINKMPHLLVAGATGSGKSVCINTMILSLLYKSTPDEVKLLMIDPKVVELNQYNGIPHLMIPVVTDPKKATGALRWAVTEMEERYHKFADNGVRDIAGYHDKMKDDNLPYIVVIIDELADLMLVAAKEVEDSICRLAQMARAAGIHLIIATQRPSVDVITGIIKANIPSRVAFSVASQVDSRTILDIGGAEKLLGKGDMLFHPIGMNKPVRIQGAFVSEEEVKSVVEYLKNQTGEPVYEEEIMERIESMPDSADEQEPDDLFQEALRMAFDNQHISISMLQRKLKMGYNRAARLIDEMEARGYVGPNEGTKPRKVMNRPVKNSEPHQMASTTSDKE